MNYSTTQILLIKPTRCEMESLILQFLAVESWSSQHNLCELLQINKRNLLSVLKPMLNKRTLKAILQGVMGGEVQLYGITRLGYKSLSNEYGVFCEDLDLNPNLLTPRISPTFIPHRLDIQMLRIRAERAGWSNWINADTGQLININKQNKPQLGQANLVSEHRPDAWCTNTLGERFCIECERTMKSKSRYTDILCNYLLALKRGDFDGVIWVCPDLDLRNKLANLITSITHVRIGLLSVLVPRNRFERLIFMTFDEWVR